MDHGYSFSWGNQHYDRHADGRPITLVEAFKACTGVGFARIWSPTGRLVLEDAGGIVQRGYNIRARRAAVLAGRAAWADKAARIEENGR